MLSFSAPEVALSDPQLALDLGGTLVAGLVQANRFDLEFSCVLLSGLSYSFPPGAVLYTFFAYPSVHFFGGTPVYAGTLRIQGKWAKSVIRTVEHPGAAAVNMEGV